MTVGNTTAKSLKYPMMHSVHGNIFSPLIGFHSAAKQAARSNELMWGDQGCDGEGRSPAEVCRLGGGHASGIAPIVRHFGEHWTVLTDERTIGQINIPRCLGFNSNFLNITTETRAFGIVRRGASSNRESAARAPFVYARGVGVHFMV